MSEQSERLSLPFLQAGQAQKDVIHNEALVLIDALVQATVEAADLSSPPPGPAPGACWIVGSDARGDWRGHAGALACWTSGGWRFIAPHEGMRAWCRPLRQELVYVDGAWEAGNVRASRVTLNGLQVVGPRSAAIVSPDGGGTVDAEARTAVDSILRAMRKHGLIAD